MGTRARNVHVAAETGRRDVMYKGDCNMQKHTRLAANSGGDFVVFVSFFFHFFFFFCGGGEGIVLYTIESCICLRV